MSPGWPLEYNKFVMEAVERRDGLFWWCSVFDTLQVVASGMRHKNKLHPPLHDSSVMILQQGFRLDPQPAIVHGLRSHAFKSPIYHCDFIHFSGGPDMESSVFVRPRRQQRRGIRRGYADGAGSRVQTASVEDVHELDRRSAATVVQAHPGNPRFGRGSEAGPVERASQAVQGCERVWKRRHPRGRGWNKYLVSESFVSFHFGPAT